MEDVDKKLPQTQGTKLYTRREFLKFSGIAAAGAIVSSLIPDVNGNPFAGNLASRFVTDLFAEKDATGAEETLRLIKKEKSSCFSTKPRVLPSSLSAWVLISASMEAACFP